MESKIRGYVKQRFSQAKELESENAELKKMYAAKSIENQASVEYLVTEEKISNRKACKLKGISRTTSQYQAKLKDDQDLQEALIVLNTKQASIGYWQYC